MNFTFVWSSHLISSAHVEIYKFHKSVSQSLLLNLVVQDDE